MTIFLPSRARLLATAAPLGLLIVANPAWAQSAATPTPAVVPASDTAPPDDQASPAQDIVVTGSILRSTSSATPSPVTTLNSDTLDKRGINTVAEALQRLSANGAGAMTQGWNNGTNFATGANAVSLRGLTVQSTLTLFDGLRMAPFPLADDGHRNFVDLNTIPDAVIDRIEILRDGASSTYGADAIAGVVNVIMKKEVRGIHANVSAGTSDKGDGGEVRADLTLGYGSLADQGFNFYVTGEYQRDRAIMASDRGYPFNTTDLSKVCQPGSTTICLANTSAFGINADGTLSSTTSTTASLVAPASATGARLGTYQLLNTALGCNVSPGLTPVTLTPSQQAFGTTGVLTGVPTWAANQCQQDLRKQYQTIQPEQERYGGAMRMTFKVGDRAQAYATASYYDVKSVGINVPGGFNSTTPPPSSVTLNPVVLPVYVCPTGVGTINPVTSVNTSTGCTAANGTLNPNNPFAAAGQNAILRSRYDRTRDAVSNARSLRGAFGISGSFGDSWTYNADFAISNVKLDIDYNNYMIPQRIADVVATGAYNFVNQTLNSQAVRDYIAPSTRNTSNSDLWTASANIGRRLFKLPGGDVQLAIGVAYRHESINNPSANPDNVAHPYDRYYLINAVGAIGARNVKSAYFELGVPVLDQLEFNASGRYDDYSSGQSNFSPKIGVKFTPIREIAFRGTFSKGFRIPSFNEAYGLPTTGYTNTTVNCATFAAYCQAHSPDGTVANANSYATASYSVGTTNVGNPALRPERSTSFTGGVIFEPIRRVSFTIDYWNIRVKDLISSISPAQIAAATSQYYLNNGVTTVPGVTAIRGVADVQFPNALPQLGFLQASFQNANSEQVSGIDFGANVTLPLLSGLTLRSSADASYLIAYKFTTDGVTYRYDGSLSPCDYTSCSGSPKWRANWQNTLDFGSFNLTGTLYYTSGYSDGAVDYGESASDCVFVNGGGYKAYKGTTIVAQCRTKATWNFDLAAQVKVADRFTLYVNALNVFGIKPPRDPSAAYSTSQYNPAWAQPNIIGRYLRVGAKVDF